MSLCVSIRALAQACACVRVALIIQHAAHRYIVICGLSGSTTFLDSTS